MARQPEANELDKAYRLDEFLMLPAQYDEFLTLLTNAIFDQQGIRFRQDAQQKTKTAASIILANLINARSAASDVEVEGDDGGVDVVTRGGWLSISLNQNAYRNTRYNNALLSYRAFVRVLDYLRNDGNEIGIDEAIGFLDRQKGAGRNTRIRFKSDAYAYFLAREEIGDEGIAVAWGAPLITNSTSQYPVSALAHDADMEIIRLKDADKNLIDYDDTPEVIAMRARLRAWNEYSLTKWADLFLPNHEFRGLLAADVDNDAGEALRDAGEATSGLFNLHHKQLYRVFNNGSWEQGGRLYGGWWQLVPSRLRNRITIDTQATIEIDYSNMQPAMIYAGEGLDLPEDAYQIDGIDRAYRKLIKRTFFQMINAGEGQQIRAPKAEELPPDTTFDQLRDMISVQHEPIAAYFNTGVGIELQKVDAEIALDVMTQAMEEEELVLPIHDSFIAHQDYEDRLKNLMTECYRERVGQNIGMDLIPAFQEDVAFPRHEPNVFDVRRVGVEGLVDHPLYSDYRDRHPQEMN